MIHFGRLTGWGLRADNDFLAAGQHGIPYAHRKDSSTVVGGANYRGNHHRGVALAG